MHDLFRGAIMDQTARLSRRPAEDVFWGNERELYDRTICLRWSVEGGDPGAGAVELGRVAAHLRAHEPSIPGEAARHAAACASGFAGG